MYKIGNIEMREFVICINELFYIDFLWSDFSVNQNIENRSEQRIKQEATSRTCETFTINILAKIFDYTRIKTI